MTTQQKKHFPLAAAMLLLMASTTQAAGNKHQFAIGPTAGLAIFSGDIGDGDEKTKLKPNFGLAARNTYHYQDGWFAGLQLALSKETAKYTEFPVEVNSGWSMDFLFRAGRNYDGISPYVAVGASLVSVKWTTKVFNVDIDTNTHLGWKIAGGIDYDISEKIQVFAQGYYADFGKKEVSNSSIDLDLSGYGTQFGILFKF